jgi:hypothetical protein
VAASLTGRWGAAVQSTPLNKRGWVYQERLLSPRVVHFARDQIYWEYFGLDASEEFVDRVWDNRPRDDNFNKSEMVNSVQEELFKLWARLVEHNFVLHLTFQTDRLRAISSIARHFCAKGGFHAENYIAGCWRQVLPYCPSTVWLVLNLPTYLRMPAMCIWTWNQGAVISSKCVHLLGDNFLNCAAERIRRQHS